MLDLGGVRIHLQSPKTKGYAADGRIAFKRGLFDAVGIIAFGRRNSLSVLAVFDQRIGIHRTGLNGGIKGADGLQQIVSVDAVLIGQLLQGVGLGSGGVIFVVPIQYAHPAMLGVEKLKGFAARLGDNESAHFGVCNSAHILALVHKPLAVDIDHDAERIGVAVIFLAALTVP